MYKAIAIYPSKEEKYLNKCEEYIKLASANGFNEVFSSMHIPEIDLSSQVIFCNELSNICREYDMDLIVDVGGNAIKQILNTLELRNILKNTKIDFIRLDYGYNHEEVSTLKDVINNKGFIINASIYDYEESKIEVEFIRSIHSQVRACHNFYPRVESGIDDEHAYVQREIFRSLNVPIYYCIPNIDNPRGPIYQGLPTIENHRYERIDKVYEELVYKYCADGILLADNFYSEEKFKAINNVIINNPIEIKVKTINNLYDDIVYKTHTFRYDSNNNYLRSKTSRQMAEFAKSIEPENCIARTRGSITIDNKKYERYSGELQVVLHDNIQDDRVNVVGYIEEKDLDKLLYYKNGFTYKFVK